MKRSNFYFVSRDAENLTEKCLVAGGFVLKQSAGIFWYLPLATKVFMRIKERFAEIWGSRGYMEMLSPGLLPVSLWKREKNELFDTHGLFLPPTHEEMVLTHKRGRFFHLSNNFRREKRVFGGLTRTLSFVMLDGYVLGEEFEKLREEYLWSADTFEKVLTDWGCVCHKQDFSSNGEISREILLRGNEYVHSSENFLEVAHSFLFSSAFDRPLVSFGVGCSRLLQYFSRNGTVELPASLQPFHVVCAGVQQDVHEIYSEVSSQFSHLNFFFDDTSNRLGEKLKNAFSLGIRHALISGKKGLTLQTLRLDATEEKVLCSGREQIYNWLKEYDEMVRLWK